MSGVPRSDCASTSAPLERRNFTISEHPEEKKKRVIILLPIHDMNKTFLLGEVSITSGGRIFVGSHFSK